MRRSAVVRRWGVGIGALALAAPAAVGSIGANASADPAYSVQTLHFLVKIGPKSDQTCDVVGDLYLPSDASSTHRVPAILATNGFGGSKDDQAGIGKAFASRDYAVLSYSGLGFGGSDCKITLDDPDYDGKAASQLVSYLGGASGIAFTDDAHKNAAPVLDVVQRDAKNHLGKVSANDPRVGMVGGSYGGEIQFAAASVDPRIDTIVPLITWNDLSYSLSPNNTSITHGVTTANTGAAKLFWALGFSGLGVADGLENAQTDPTRLFPCPNFATWVCPGLVNAAVTGGTNQSTTTYLRHASVESYMSSIKVPVLLAQGQNDTLFNLNEAVATYTALKKQGTPVSMIWQQWGHSDSTPAPGEIDLNNPDPTTQYETGRIMNWFDHYLKGSSVSTGPNFAYFRDWVDYTGIATPAYATASSYPVGTATKYYLSNGKSLVTSPTQITKGTQTFVTDVAGLPTSLDPVDVLGSAINGLPQPETDLPGTFAMWQTPALTSNVDVVGSPSLALKIDAPSAVLTQSAGYTGQVVVFVKVLDVGTDGIGRVVRNLVAPARVQYAQKAFTVTLPAFVHRFAPGHHIRLEVAGGSVNYRGGLVPTAVSITTGASSQVLSLPTVK